MCGIFGYRFAGHPGLKLLKSMAQKQIHRGPDDEGYYIDGTTAIGMRRLSIIDLTGGQQPISNEEKTVWVVCNGEIYNYVELRNELAKKGHVFRTNSDVECLVHLYEEHGLDMLKQLNGMYAFALYDQKKDQLLLAKDRLGIKPLYYSCNNKKIAFSSEIKSLFEVEWIDREIDDKAISQFLMKMYIDAPLTPFKGIRKLPPASYMLINREGDISIKKYWDVSYQSERYVYGSEEAVIGQLQSLLEDSARLQLRADVPLCIFLSGGLDSSAVTAYAAMNSPKTLTTFHAHFEGSTNKLDERTFAAQIAKQYGTKHHEVLITQNDFNRLATQTIWYNEEPLGDLATIPTLVLSRKAVEMSKVCLNGAGGDELFGGYPRNRPYNVLKTGLKHYLSTTTAGRNLLKRLGARNIAQFWKTFYPNFIDDRLNGNHALYGPLLGNKAVNNSLKNEINTYLPSNILFLLDKMTMAASLEGRVPLLDHRIVEYAVSLPANLKFKNKSNKYIFTKLLRGLLPPQMFDRPKEGFGAPLNDWLNQKTINKLRSILEGGFCAKNGILHIKNDSLNGLRDWEIWKLSCLEIWFRMFVDGQDDLQTLELMQL